MSLSVDDLLKEFDDLPGGARSSSRGVRVQPSAPPPAQMPCRDSTPALFQSPRSSPSASAVQPSASSGSRSASKGKRDDLEALLNDLDFGGTPYNSMNGRNNPRAVAAAEAAVQKLAAPSRNSSVIGSKQKCTGVFVGGTSFSRGRMGAVGTVTCCDALRCTKCDFRVEQFNNRDWIDDVDYLFFRNNFPTEAKLAAKMRTRAESVAYCCQCSWMSTVESSKLDFSSDVRWVCAGHLTE